MIADAPATAWSAGRLDGAAGAPRVLFGRMYEDWTIEQAAFRPGARVFCIASAGCTAMRLSVERTVVAVDINPVQLAYAAARVRGDPVQRGTAEQLMRFGRALLPLAGWHASSVRAFLDLTDPAEQIAVWKREFDTRRFRAGMQLLLSAATLGRAYASPLVGALPRDFARVMQARMERCFALHSNRSNPFARALLLGEERADPVPVDAAHIELACADAAEFLEQTPQRFDGFTLSNIVDGANEAYRTRLFRAVARAATPGAVVVLRSFGEPATPSAFNRAAEDRSMLWGIVDVRAVSALAA